MRLAARSVSALGVLLALGLTAPGCAGCGCGDGDGIPDVPEGPYGEVLLSACDLLDRCPDAIGYPIAYRNRDECAAILNFVLTCHVTEKDIGNDTTIYGLEERRPEVDDQAADACIEWLDEASCGDLSSGQDSPCTLVLSGGFDDDDGGSGTAAVDEPCSTDDDCLPELYCQPGSADEASGIVTCQVCRPRVAAGAECMQYSRMCEGDLHCRYEEGGPRRCAPLDPDGGRCVEHEQCASGFCNYALEELGGWGQCDPGGNEGDPCRPEIEGTGQGSDCRTDLFCDAGTCAPRRPNGASCAADLQCAHAQCHPETDVCGLPDGEACTDRWQCAADLCIEGTCGGPPGACAADDQCAEEEYCAGACRPPSCSCSGDGCPVGTCTPDGGGGGGCTDDEECPSGVCEDGVCAAPVNIGDPCTDSYECYPRGTCSDGVCVAKHGPGDQCTALDSCQEPFLCIEGRCRMMNLVCEPASAGELCAWLRVCDEGSYCDFLDGVTCKSRFEEGEECVTSFMRGIETCAVGTTCAADESGTQRCVRRPDLGEPCTGPCVEGAYCFEGTCQADPIGRPCDYDLPCPAGLFCSDDAEVCLPPGGQGAACEDAFECAPGLYCRSYDTCEPRLGRGEECRDTFECSEELYCEWDTYTCQPDVGAGETCDSREAPCAEGQYCPSGISDVCTAQGGPGDPCSSNEQCASGACYSYSWCQAEPGCVIP